MSEEGHCNSKCVNMDDGNTKKKMTKIATYYPQAYVEYHRSRLHKLGRRKISVNEGIKAVTM